MKINYKKFIYLINDLSGMLLNKERAGHEAANKKLKTALIVFIALFFLSFIINIILAFKL